MKNLLKEIRRCDLCRESLPHPPRPVLSASIHSKIVIIGQAPGSKVHSSGIPWDDQSGKQLRHWLGVSRDEFYDPDNFAIIPMGFCYPGKGKTGDLPPRKECAAQWHAPLFKQLTKVKLTLLIGQYAQKYTLRERAQKNLTATVKQYKDYLPTYFVLPHPSPRNRFWLINNPWFTKDVVNNLQVLVAKILH